jgi:hypothetical protein
LFFYFIGRAMYVMSICLLFFCGFLSSRFAITYQAKTCFYRATLDRTRVDPVRIGLQHPLTCREWGTVRLRLRIGPYHHLVCCKSRLDGAVLRMKPEKLRPRVTAGVA